MRKKCNRKRQDNKSLFDRIVVLFLHFKVDLKVALIRSQNFFKMAVAYSFFNYILLKNLGQLSSIFTEKNTVISSNFLVLKFCGKAQFPQSFG